ncbi:MAG TPA: hypothetical protein DEP84_11725, partial [Chloroflexi bacterium]|nr:hypothetical protein [Chloroflexota bacterium]
GRATTVSTGAGRAPGAQTQGRLRGGQVPQLLAILNNAVLTGMDHLGLTFETPRFILSGH